MPLFIEYFPIGAAIEQLDVFPQIWLVVGNNGVVSSMLEAIT